MGTFIKYESRTKLTDNILENLRLHPADVPGATCFTFDQFSPGDRWAFAEEKHLAQLRAFEAKCSRRDRPTLFEMDGSSIVTLGDIADIGNGLVSGLDRAFQCHDRTPLTEFEQKALVPVLKAKHLEAYGHGPYTYYFMLNELVSNEAELKAYYPNIYHHLKGYQQLLVRRYAYGRELPYWEWAFLRNLTLFRNGNSRIFVPCKERVSNKGHFRFSIAPAEAFPTQDVTAIVPRPGVRESAGYLTALLNNPMIYEWILVNGVVKGNVVEFCEKPLSRIPIRLIDWDNPEEVALHDRISELSRGIAEVPRPEDLTEIETLVCSLI